MRDLIVKVFPWPAWFAYRKAAERRLLSLRAPQEHPAPVR